MRRDPYQRELQPHSIGAQAKVISGEKKKKREENEFRSENRPANSLFSFSGEVKIQKSI